MAETATFAERYDALVEELTALDRANVNIVAVSKGQPVAAVRDALAAGVTTLGENYAQELVAKANELDAAEASAVHWHFIGGLQTNKVRAIASRVALWQSLDRRSVIEEVGRRASGARGLIQVNLSGEAGRHGCSPTEVENLLGVAAAAGVEITGLMGVASATGAAQVHSEFSSLVRLADQLGLAERCIGMSGDFRIAVQCGSTMIRIGSRLFGARFTT